MGRTIPSHRALPRPTSFIHTYDEGGFYFHQNISDYFPIEHIEDRLQKWSDATVGHETLFRKVLEWTPYGGGIRVTLSDLPSGYQSMASLLVDGLSQEARAEVLANVCRALSLLHQRGFVMGFLSPELMYVHPETLEVHLDIQPYPTTIPFINQMEFNFPFILFSRYTRVVEYHRIADYYALNLLTQWMFSGTFPNEEGDLVAGLSESLAQICLRLSHNPESFLFVEEIHNEFALCFGVKERCELPVVSNALNWLHPMEAPITQADQMFFRHFLRERGPHIVAVVAQDDSTRNDVVRMHFNEVLESDLLLTIECKNMPFATLREMADFTLSTVRRYFPELTMKMRRLSNQFNRLLRKHYEGDDVVHQFSNWLVQLYKEVTPIFEKTAVYYNFESCENFDDESLQVLVQFWQQFGKTDVRSRFLLSGRQLPNGLFATDLTVLNLQVNEAVYKRLIMSQLGRVEQASLDRLVSWCNRQSPLTYLLPMLLETLIQNGTLELILDEWVVQSVLEVMSEEAIREKIRERLRLLNEPDIEELRVLSSLPSPIRPVGMYERNNLSAHHVPAFVMRLARLGLLRVYHVNSIHIPEEVGLEAMHGLPHEQQLAYRREALRLQQGFKPKFLPALIDLARTSEDVAAEYYFYIKYYRQIRSMISYSRRVELLETLKTLQIRLGRNRILAWDRLLTELYVRLNDYRKAEQLANALYARTGSRKDKVTQMFRKMFQNELNVEEAKVEMFSLLLDSKQALSDRCRAALFIMRSDFYLPLSRDEAERIDRFYRTELMLHSDRISERQSIRVTISYTIMLLLNFPEQQDWAHILLEMLEAVLEDSRHAELMIEFQDAHVFQTHVGNARKYVNRSLETSRRLGFKSKEQIGHLNGMELALYQGDVTSYKHHKQNATRVDEIKRADLIEQYQMHQLNYACEWKNWTLFDELAHSLRQQDLTEFTLSIWPIYQCYAAYRRGCDLPEKPNWQKENQHTLFVDALYEIRAGRMDEACALLQKCINANSYHLTAGWAYRELITILVEIESAETIVWLNQFETYLKNYAYDVFWPDYYRLSAVWSMKQNEFQQGILFLRRAMNLYQLIDKPGFQNEMAGELNSVVKPQYLSDDSPLWVDPLARKLLSDREQFLNQSLDLLVILQLSQQVTESLDLNTTVQHLSNALFDYFPVTHVAVRYQLTHRVESVIYSVSGMVDTEEFFKTYETGKQVKYEFILYRHGEQSITLDIHLQHYEETKQQHMKQFLSVIKSHIANSIHYLEMMTDNLTGFYQRRYFGERLSRELMISNRYGLDLSVMMLDIDNFRLINEFGHPEGDKVLRELANVVRSVLRHHDIPGRYGGEEILVILPKTDGTHALKIAEKIRQHIEDEFVGRPYKVTVSIGVASLRLNGTADMDELVSYADHAEIHAKTTGKNKVVAAWNLVE